MYNQFSEFLKGKQRLCIIQAENPDGDSLGSALALDEILGDDYETTLYCPVDIPKYLRYFKDWSRIEIDFDYQADGYIIVDTASTILLSKLLDDSAIRKCLYDKPVFVFDHHESECDLEFEHTLFVEDLPACCSLIYKVAKDQNLKINPQAAEYLLAGIEADTLGLTSPSTTADTFRTAAELTELGANIAQMEESRREFMKKSPRILSYKADLIKRIDYSLDGQLATVHIPWADIHEYSDEYNPGVLIIEEMRLVEGVEVAVAVKTYPDGRVTGKIRTSTPIADQIAGYFGGGGHAYAAGFRTYDTDYTEVLRGLVQAVERLNEEARHEQI